MDPGISHLPAIPSLRLRRACAWASRCASSMHLSTNSKNSSQEVYFTILGFRGPGGICVRSKASFGDPCERDGKRPVLVLEGDYIKSRHVRLRGAFSHMQRALGQLQLLPDPGLEEGANGELLVHVSDLGNTGYADDSGVETAGMCRRVWRLTRD